jgi:AraC-like DNA-binding protein
LNARLASDASLDGTARDLGMSARTLRRRLSALGASFQDLLDEVRRARAIACVLETEVSLDDVGSQLGY